ncbi:hypothetical protein CEXT_717401 [Caerostris extrusa]|uniref:Uncharacterized protein n=1 Tax=Caerostris extrusa TaxID=172846 RepID=A0AAV4RHZ6_CAEEX|nr:hypothetical protein CEXT_717401 [Caerostris extrusa]
MKKKIIFTEANSCDGGSKNPDTYFVQEAFCWNQDFRLDCNWNSVLAFHEAYFTNDEAQVNRSACSDMRDGREPCVEDIRESINKRCSGMSHCHYNFTEDHPERECRCKGVSSTCATPVFRHTDPIKFGKARQRLIFHLIEYSCLHLIIFIPRRFSIEKIGQIRVLRSPAFLPLPRAIIAEIIAYFSKSLAFRPNNLSFPNSKSTRKIGFAFLVSNRADQRDCIWGSSVQIPKKLSINLFQYTLL